jgi:hypothetical protein
MYAPKVTIKNNTEQCYALLVATIGKYAVPIKLVVPQNGGKKLYERFTSTLIFILTAPSLYFPPLTIGQNSESPASITTFIKK